MLSQFGLPCFAILVCPFFRFGLPSEAVLVCPCHLCFQLLEVKCYGFIKKLFCFLRIYHHAQIDPSLCNGSVLCSKNGSAQALCPDRLLDFATANKKSGSVLVLDNVVLDVHRISPLKMRLWRISMIARGRSTALKKYSSSQIISVLGIFPGQDEDFGVKTFNLTIKMIKNRLFWV